MKKSFNSTKKEVDKYNQFFGDYEKIKRYHLLPDEWTQQNSALSPTLKIKRNVIGERYKKEIEQLFK